MHSKPDLKNIKKTAIGLKWGNVILRPFHRPKISPEFNREKPKELKEAHVP